MPDASACDVPPVEAVASVMVSVEALPGVSTTNRMDDAGSPIRARFVPPEALRPRLSMKPNGFCELIDSVPLSRVSRGVTAGQTASRGLRDVRHYALHCAADGGEPGSRAVQEIEPGYGGGANCTSGLGVFAEPFFGVMADWSHG